MVKFQSFLPTILGFLPTSKVLREQSYGYLKRLEKNLPNSPFL